MERTGVAYTGFPPSFVCCYQGEELQGAIGISEGSKKNPLTAEKFHDFDLLARLSAGLENRRCLLGEMGTLSKSRQSTARVTIWVCAAAIIHSRSLGIKHLVFITNSVIKRMAGPLGLRLTILGRADFGRCDAAMQKAWASYSKYPLETIGIDTDQGFDGSLAFLRSQAAEVDISDIINGRPYHGQQAAGKIHRIIEWGAAY